MVPMSHAPNGKDEIELLAPGGDVDSIKAAILAGADAVYCGLERFSARARATNIKFEDLGGVLGLAHRNDCKVFLTINTIIVESEIPSLFELLNRLANTTIDGIIVQDLGLLHLLSTHFKSLNVHASTQLTTHNEGQIRFLAKLSVTRANLSRELNISELKALTLAGREVDVSTEIFVHGSYCISFSGICYLSSVINGKSGNRGKCSQPCRGKYLTTPMGKQYPLNLKDNSAFFDLKEIADAGVAAIKIEGRMKKSHYVYTVAKAWRTQLRSFYDSGVLGDDDRELYTVFNRDLTNSFMTGRISRDMFIDNPLDQSAQLLSDRYDCSTEDKAAKAMKMLYEGKAKVIEDVQAKTAQLSVAKGPLKIIVSGKLGSPLKVKVDSPEASYEVLSDIRLIHAQETDGAHGEHLDREMLLGRLNRIGATEYHIDELEMGGLQTGLFLPYREITEISKRIVAALNGSAAFVEPIGVPDQAELRAEGITPTLSILISSRDDLHLCEQAKAEVYYQLPDCLATELPSILELFNSNSKILPWFPSVMIGGDYSAAVEFLRLARPPKIITDNTGVAFAAWEMGIPWIAGPHLNVVNSLSLICLKERFDCLGAFVSNEISAAQIRRIQKPDDFELFYSIYHPIVLLTSRQCLFHQVTGCEKARIDDACHYQCDQSSPIIHHSGFELCLEKPRGDYNRVYNEDNFLNTRITEDIPHLFNGFLVDLRERQTRTKVGIDKAKLIELFLEHIHGSPESAKALEQSLSPTTVRQYSRGI